MIGVCAGDIRWRSVQRIDDWGLYRGHLIGICAGDRLLGSGQGTDDQKLVKEGEGINTSWGPLNS